MLASNAGRLRLDTGNFIFDNYADKDVQKTIAAQLGYDMAAVRSCRRARI